MTLTMFDSIVVDTVPDNPQAVAGYVGGWWPTYSPLVQRFPGARHLSIAVRPDENADCLDIENGDAVPRDAPAWVWRQLRRGVTRPAVYSSLSEMPGVLAALAASGIPRSKVRVWTAHYNFVAHICSPACGLGFDTTADATQFTDRALGRNLDESMVADSFFDAAPVAASNRVHYGLFPTGPFPSRWGGLNERKVVERYDGARKHWRIFGPYLNRVLRPQLQFLADRVAFEARAYPARGKPSWGVNHRGVRFQQLVHRAQGARFA